MKTIALYPGSFNPFHIGHLNIVKKAEKIFGKGNVIVAMGINPDKATSQKSIFIDDLTKTKRDEILSEKIGVEVISYSNFLHQLVESYESQGYNVVIIRGLRNGADLDYEVNQMRFIKDFKKDVNVVYITCDQEFEHISSSAIRKITEFGGTEMSKQYLV
jgi:pantetheine-phosphate adenylyltransferase